MSTTDKKTYIVLKPDVVKDDFGIILQMGGTMELSEDESKGLLEQEAIELIKPTANFVDTRTPEQREKDSKIEVTVTQTHGPVATIAAMDNNPKKPSTEAATRITDHFHFITAKGIKHFRPDEDKEENRKLLIDLEDHVGVIMRMAPSIEVVPYHYYENLCGKCKKPKSPSDSNLIVKEVEYCNCGRPSKYTTELLAKCHEYLALKMPNKDTDEVVHSIFGLCDYPGIDINMDTAYTWAKDSDKEEFSDILKEIMKKQGKTLISGGLSERFSGSITKLMLTKHGFRDSTENLNREIPLDPEAKKRSDDLIAEYLKDNEKQP